MAVRKPRKLKPADLKDAALHYLGRYAASTARLRQVFIRRIRRSAEAHDFEPAPLLAELERVIDRLVGSGLLNDQAFAEARTRSLHQRGGSRRQIAAKLAGAGVAKATAGDALARLQEDLPEAELEAAFAYAKRRRLGAFRTVPDDSPERRRKDLGSMARAGFSLDFARRALKGEDDER